MIYKAVQHSYSPPHQQNLTILQSPHLKDGAADKKTLRTHSDLLVTRNPCSPKYVDFQDNLGNLVLTMVNLRGWSWDYVDLTLILMILMYNIHRIWIMTNTILCKAFQRLRTWCSVKNLRHTHRQLHLYIKIYLQCIFGAFFGPFFGTQQCQIISKIRWGVNPCLEKL